MPQFMPISPRIGPLTIAIAEPEPRRAAAGGNFGGRERENHRQILGPRAGHHRVHRNLLDRVLLRSAILGGLHPADHLVGTLMERMLPMLSLLRAEASQSFGRGPFRIRRMHPGAIFCIGADIAFGSLSVVDHASLAVGTVVPMHEHKNDEILNYLWRGTMLHQDTAGNRIPLAANKLMMMNAGRSFWHEERTPRMRSRCCRSSFARVKRSSRPWSTSMIVRMVPPPASGLYRWPRRRRCAIDGPQRGAR